jgi:hypothetical protein
VVLSTKTDCCDKTEILLKVVLNTIIIAVTIEKRLILFCGKKKHSDSTNRFSETDIIKMLEF